MKWCLYSHCCLTLTTGRTAHEEYRKFRRFLPGEVEIISPWDRQFEYLDQFFRWLDEYQPDVMVVWTQKGEENYVADYARRRGAKVLFAENGWMPQAGNIYVDEQGIGPRSSLATYKPPETNETFEHAHEKGGRVGVVLQVENDWQFKNNRIIKSNAHLVEMLMCEWPEEHFLVRPHPYQQDVWLPDDPRVIVERDGGLYEFFGKVKCVAGANSTCLIQALQHHYAVYQLGRGIGYGSGAFITYPVPPSEALKPTKANLQRQKDAHALVTDLLKRQFNPDTITAEEIAEHPVLGPLVKGEAWTAESSPKSEPQPV